MCAHQYSFNMASSARAFHTQTHTYKHTYEKRIKKICGASKKAARFPKVYKHFIDSILQLLRCNLYSFLSHSRSICTCVGSFFGIHPNLMIRWANGVMNEFVRIEMLSFLLYRSHCTCAASILYACRTRVKATLFSIKHLQNYGKSTGNISSKAFDQMFIFCSNQKSIVCSQISVELFNV